MTRLQAAFHAATHLYNRHSGRVMAYYRSFERYSHAIYDYAAIIMEHDRCPDCGWMASDPPLRPTA